MSSCQIPSYFTDEMIQLLKDEYPEKGPSYFVELFKCSSSGVKNAASALGLKYKHRNKTLQGFVKKRVEQSQEIWTSERLEILRQRYPQEGPSKLALEWDLKEHAVSAKANFLGLKTPGRFDRRSQNSKSVNNTYFDHWTNNSAYILGYIFADGSIQAQTEIGRYTLRFRCQKRDRKLLEIIREEMKIQSIIRDRWITSKKTGKKYEASYLDTTSKRLVTRLVELGVLPRKSKLNPPYPTIPDDFFSHFLRGYIDGDGGIYYNKRDGSYSVSALGSPFFMSGLQEQTISLIGVSKFPPYKKKSLLVFSWSSKEDVKKLNDFLYSDTGISLERKKLKFIKSQMEQTPHV